jgi:hypothetical protein
MRAGEWNWERLSVLFSNAFPRFPLAGVYPVGTRRFKADAHALDHKQMENPGSRPRRKPDHAITAAGLSEPLALF